MSASQPAYFNVQEFTDAGILLVGGRLYTYAYGTTTQKTAYTDAAGTVPQTYTSDGIGGQYIALNARGELPTPLYLGTGSYDLSLKRSDGSTVWTRRADGVDSAAVAGFAALSGPNGSTLVGHDRVNWTVDQQLDMLYYGVSNVRDTQFAGGATVGGLVDCRAAIQAAINARVAAGGGVVKLPPGRFLINPTSSPDGIQNGVVVPYSTAHGTANRVWIEGSGAETVLVAGGDNMVLLRYADSHGGVQSMSFDGNGKTNVWGLGVIPEDMTQTTTNVYTIYNVFRDLYMTGLAEGIYMTYGPKVGGSDSGCYYNRYDNIHIYSCLRGLYAPSRPVAFGGGVGRNLFSNIRVGQNCNTGLQMDAGGTNTFLHCNFEGISLGATPNATPSAIIVTGTGNNFNYFIGCHIEACTRDIECNTTYVYWTGGSFDSTKCLFTQPMRTVLVDGLATMGFIGGGVSTPLAAFHLVTPGGADYRASSVGLNAYHQTNGGVNATWTFDCANANGQHIYKINGTTYATLDVLGHTIVGRFACNGATAQPSYASGAAATDLASAIALVNKLQTALKNNGICT